MNSFVTVSDSGTLPEESSYFNSVGKPFAAVCIRTSTERQEAMERGCFVLSGVKEEGLLQSVNMATMMRDYCSSVVPDYKDTNVSDKIVKLIQSYTRVVDEFVWSKLK